MACASVQATERTIIWTGAGDGVKWSDFNNWDLDLVPKDTAVNQFNVIIPPGWGSSSTAVRYDLTDAPHTIKTLDLGGSSWLNPVAGTDLTVTDTATLAGLLNVDGGRFTAVGAGTTLAGTTSRVYGANAAKITIAAPTYSSTGLWADSGTSGVYVYTYVLMTADGAGSILDLSSIQSMNAGFSSTGNDYNVQKVTASNGGSINLSGVQTITVPRYGKDRLDITVDNGAINLAGLSTIESVSTGPNAGYANLIATNGGSINLPSLQTASQTRFTATNGSSVSLPSLQTASQTMFTATAGGRIDANGIRPVAYSSTQFWTDSGTAGDYTYTYALMTADGAGSILDLSSIQSMDAGFSSTGNDYNVQQVTASNGGSINLSGVQTITVPRYGKDRLDITVDSGAINLAGLNTIQSVYTGGNAGYAHLTATNGSSVSLPSLQTASQTIFTATTGGKIDANGIRPVAYSSTQFWTDSGTAGAYTYTYALMTADGAGSILDLSSIQSMNAGFSSTGNDYNVQKVTASNGGVINLSGVKILTVPVSNRDHLEFAATGGALGGALLDMSGLEAITPPAGGGSGWVGLSASAGGELRFGAVRVTAATRLTLDDGVAKFAGIEAVQPITVTVTLNKATDRLEIAGSLALKTLITVTAPAGGTVKIGGDFTHQWTDESKAALKHAVVQLAGHGTNLAPQGLEVGGVDMDIDVGSLNNDNFGFGQLVVGEDGRSTVVQLQDLYDNGNRAGGSLEALYLFGLDSQDGLRILGDSTLALAWWKPVPGQDPVYREANVYAMVGGQLIHVNDLFPPGDNEIPFDQGQIVKMLPEPASIMLLLGGLSLLLARRRVA
jgi:hypothetical protein